MSGEAEVLRLIASIFVRERKAVARWAQMRRVTCGRCRTRFWALATREVTGTSLGLRLVTDERSTEANAVAAARKRAMDEAERRSAAMVSCPACEWVPAGVEVRAWARAVFLAMIPAAIVAIPIVLIAMFAFARGPVFAICAACIGAVWALASWVARTYVCRLPWGLAMDRYPTASLKWGNDLLVACDAQGCEAEESWLRRQGIPFSRDALILTPPVDV